MYTKFKRLEKKMKETLPLKSKTVLNHSSPYGMLIFQMSFTLEFCFPFSLHVLLELSSLCIYFYILHHFLRLFSITCSTKQILRFQRGDHVVRVQTKPWPTPCSQGLPNCHYDGFLWVQ